MVMREIMHSFQSSNAAGQFFSYKCDLSKAFDRMEWGYISQVLTWYGFPRPFTAWIRECITSACYSILFNGHADGFITPSRGLRQRCALSPYLFILCMDILSRILDLNADKGYITGIKVARQAPRLTSIMFADDLIIFGSATTDQATRTLEILDFFCKMSGQMIGHDKSSIWFSKHTPIQEQESIRRILNATMGSNTQIYLGVPVNASRPCHFNHLINKIQAKFAAWTARTLSQAGKITLIRSVIEPLIVFHTAGGAIPATTANQIDTLIRGFVWNSGGKRKMHLIGWDCLTRHKCQGGLGIRSASQINRAAMLKILWKLASKEHDDTPWVQLLKGKYLANKSLWLAGEPRNCTKLWRSLMSHRSALIPHLRWQLGNGEKCRVFGEPWHTAWRSMTPTNAHQCNLPVQSLVNSAGSNWSDEMLSLELGTALGLLIKTIYPQAPNPASRREDRLLYTNNSSGSFSFKEACKLIKSPHDEIDANDGRILNTIWYCPGLIPRVRLFLWKLWHNAIPVAGIHAARMQLPVPDCAICNSGPDLPLHSLFLCPLAETFWFASYLSLRTANLPTHIRDLLLSLCQSLKETCSSPLPTTSGLYGKQGAPSSTMANPLKYLMYLAKHSATTGCQDLLQTSLYRNPSGTYGSTQMHHNKVYEYLLMAHLTTWAEGVGLTQQAMEKYCYNMGWMLVLLTPHCTQRLRPILLAIRELDQIGINEATFFTDCLQLQQILDGRISPDSVAWQEFHCILELLDSFRLRPGLCCSFTPRENNWESHMLANYTRLHRISCSGVTFPSFPSIDVINLY